jgi:prephenate dehydrogenase
MNDEDGFFLQNAKIAIVGLGLMGGSLALALKGKCAELLGVDQDPSTRELALRQNIVSQADADPAKILPLADVVILAIPVPAILALLEQLSDLMSERCIVLDLGSSKAAIAEAMNALPERFDTLPAHPLCGREKLSLENADATLYNNATFFLLPLARTSLRARACGEQILAAIGAHPHYVDPLTHDAALSATSHLPYLICSALALATPTEVAPFVGTGFRSTARLAATPQSMMFGVLRSNRENVLASLARFQTQISSFAAALGREDYEALSNLLTEAQEHHHKLIS